MPNKTFRQALIPTILGLSLALRLPLAAAVRPAEIPPGGARAPLGFAMPDLGTARAIQDSLRTLNMPKRFPKLSDLSGAGLEAEQARRAAAPIAQILAGRPDISLEQALLAAGPLVNRRALRLSLKALAAGTPEALASAHSELGSALRDYTAILDTKEQRALSYRRTRVRLTLRAALTRLAKDWAKRLGTPPGDALMTLPLSEQVSKAGFSVRLHIRSQRPADQERKNPAPPSPDGERARPVDVGGVREFDGYAMTTVGDEVWVHLGEKWEPLLNGGRPARPEKTAILHESLYAAFGNELYIYHNNAKDGHRIESASGGEEILRVYVSAGKLVSEGKTERTVRMGRYGTGSLWKPGTTASPTPAREAAERLRRGTARRAAAAAVAAAALWLPAAAGPLIALMALSLALAGMRSRDARAILPASLILAGTALACVEAWARHGTLPLLAVPLALSFLAWSLSWAAKERLEFFRAAPLAPEASARDRALAELKRELMAPKRIRAYDLLYCGILLAFFAAMSGFLLLG